MTWHIGAKPGEIADKILLPGDPLRAKHIANTFFENPILINEIRNMLGYTGTYKGHKVSVLGTGMGMPSMAMVAEELIQDHGVKKLIRVGTCGALNEKVKVRDVVIALGATTDSSMPHNIFGPSINFAPIPDYSLLENSVAAARELKKPFHVGNVLSQDRLFDDEINMKKLASYEILAAEMEAAALFLTAAKHHVQSAAIMTVSNHILTGEETPAKERETSFNDMVEIALEAVIR